MAIHRRKDLLARRGSLRSNIIEERGAKRISYLPGRFEALAKGDSYLVHGKLSDPENQEIDTADPQDVEKLFEFYGLSEAPELPRIYFILEDLLYEGKIASNEELLYLLNCIRLPSIESLVSESQKWRNKFEPVPNFLFVQKSRMTEQGEVSTDFKLVWETWNLFIEFLTDLMENKNQYERFQRLVKEVNELWSNSSLLESPGTLGLEQSSKEQIRRVYIGKYEHDREYFLSGKRPLESSIPSPPPVVASGMKTLNELIVPLSQLFNQPAWHQLQQSFIEMLPSLQDLFMSLPRVNSAIKKIFALILKVSNMKRDIDALKSKQAAFIETKKSNIKTQPGKEAKIFPPKRVEPEEALKVWSNTTGEGGGSFPATTTPQDIKDQVRKLSTKVYMTESDVENILNREPGGQEIVYSPPLSHGYSRPTPSPGIGEERRGEEFQFQQTQQRSRTTDRPSESHRETAIYVQGPAGVQTQTGGTEKESFYGYEQEQEDWETYGKPESPAMTKSIPAKSVSFKEKQATESYMDIEKEIENTRTTYQSEIIQDLKDLFLVDFQDSPQMRYMLLGLLKIIKDSSKLVMMMIEPVLKSQVLSEALDREEMEEQEREKIGGGELREEEVDEGLKKGPIKSTKRLVRTRIQLLSLLERTLPPILLSPLTHARELIESFLNSTSLLPLLTQWVDFLHLFILDQYNLKDWLSDSYVFLSDSLSRNPDYIQSEEWKGRANYLLQRVETVEISHYQTIIANWNYEYQKISRAAEEDPWNQKWRQKWSELWSKVYEQLQRETSTSPIISQSRDVMGFSTATLDWIAYAASTLPKRIINVINESSELILPFIFQSVENLPLPRLEGSGKHLHFWLDDLRVTPLFEPLSNKLPWIIRIHEAKDWTVWPARVKNEEMEQVRLRKTGADAAGWSERDKVELRKGEKNIRKKLKNSSKFIGTEASPEELERRKRKKSKTKAKWFIARDRATGIAKRSRPWVRSLVSAIKSSSSNSSITAQPLLQGSHLVHAEDRYYISIKNVSLLFPNVRFTYRVRSRLFGFGVKKKTVSDTGTFNLLLGKETTWSSLFPGSGNLPSMGKERHKRLQPTAINQKMIDRNQGVCIWLEVGTPIQSLLTSLTAGGKPTGRGPLGGGKEAYMTPNSLLKVYSVRVKIDQFKLDVHGQHHSTLYKWNLPLMQPYIKKKLEKFLEEQVLMSVSQLDLLLVTLMKGWLEPISLILG